MLDEEKKFGSTIFKTPFTMINGVYIHTYDI